MLQPALYPTDVRRRRPAMQPLRRRMPPALGCAAGILLSCLPYHTDTMPTLRSGHEAIPQEWTDEPIVILSDSTCFRLVPTDTANIVRRYQRTVFLVNKQHPDHLQKLTFTDNETLERPPAVRVTVLYPDDTRWRWTNGGTERYRVPNAPGYSSNEFIQGVSLPKYKQGMIVEQIVERTYTHPEFLSAEVIRKAYPIISRTVTLAYPEGGGITRRLVDEEGIGVDSAQRTEGTQRIVEFTAENLRKIDDVDAYPEPERWLAVAYFSFPPRGTVSFTWEQLGDYYLSALKGAYTGTDRLGGSVAEIGNGPADSVFSRIMLFIRGKLRYHGNFDGIHGIVPHTVASILDNGYGDCKDMSIIGQSIARKKGLAAGLMLVNADDGIQAHPSVPSLGTFNHVVLFLDPPGGGARLIVDPTATFGDPLHTVWNYIGRKALFLREKGSFLDTVARPPSFINRVSTSSSIFRCGADSTWRIAGTATLYGLTAMKLYPEFRELSQEQRMPVLKKYLRSFFEIDAQTASFDMLDGEIMSIRWAASFQENYVSLGKGGFILNKPSIFGGDVRFTTLSYPGPRFFNEFEQVDSWSLPKKYVDLDNNELASPAARGSWAIDRNTATRTFRQKQCILSDDSAGVSVSAKNNFVKTGLWKH